MFSSVIFWSESCCPSLPINCCLLGFFPLGSHFFLDSGSEIPPGKPGGCCHFWNQPPSHLNTHLDTTCGCLCWVLGLFPGLHLSIGSWLSLINAYLKGNRPWRPFLSSTVLLEHSQILFPWSLALLHTPPLCWSSGVFPVLYGKISNLYKPFRQS